MIVPEYLRSTYDLLTETFPDGIDGNLYVPLLAFFEERLSHRNLADVIALVTNGTPAGTYQDVRGAASAVIRDEDLAEVKRRLGDHQLGQWLSEPWQIPPER